MRIPPSKLPPFPPRSGLLEPCWLIAPPLSLANASNVFEANEALQYGGALYLWASAYYSCAAGDVFHDNIAQLAGGGLFWNYDGSGMNATDVADYDKRAARRGNAHGAGGNALVMKELRKVYRPKRPGAPPTVACANMCAGVAQGEIFGLLGANGAGKTTAMSMVMRAVDPTAGEAFVAGHTVLQHAEFLAGATSLRPRPRCLVCVGIGAHACRIWIGQAQIRTGQKVRACTSGCRYHSAGPGNIAHAYFYAVIRFILPLLLAVPDAVYADRLRPQVLVRHTLSFQRGDQLLHSLRIGLIRGGGAGADRLDACGETRFVRLIFGAAGSRDRQQRFVTIYTARIGLALRAGR